jgi:hypothetical protein
MYKNIPKISPNKKASELKQNITNPVSGSAKKTEKFCSLITVEGTNIALTLGSNNSNLQIEATVSSETSVSM